MTWSQGSARHGWSALPALIRSGWLLLGTALAVGLTATALGLGTPVVAGVLAVLISLGLVLGLITLTEWTGSAGPRLAGGPFGPVPPSWEYYETFGR